MKKHKKRHQKHLNKSQRREVIRGAEYLVSGGAYFWSGYLTFFICDAIFGLNLWWAKLLANVVGWTVNYALQRYWVFNNPNLSKHELEVSGRYIFITLINWLLDYAIVWTLREFGLTPYIGQFVASGFFTVWNYFWYRFWVFPHKFKKHKKAAKA